jgi:hypothetical protein
MEFPCTTVAYLQVRWKVPQVPGAVLSGNGDSAAGGSTTRIRRSSSLALRRELVQAAGEGRRARIAVCAATSLRDPI